MKAEKSNTMNRYKKEASKKAFQAAGRSAFRTPGSLKRAKNHRRIK